MIIIKQINIDSFIIEINNNSIIVNPTRDINNLEKFDLILLSIEEDAFSSLKFLKLLCSAGEIELKSIFIQGAKNKNINSFNYLIHFDNISVGIIHGVNDINNVNDSIFADIDLLIIGAGGGKYNLLPKDAEDLVEKLAPSFAIFYGFNLNSADNFNLNFDRISLVDFKKVVESAIAINKPFELKNLSFSNPQSVITEKLFFESYAKI